MVNTNKEKTSKYKIIALISAFDFLILLTLSFFCYKYPELNVKQDTAIKEEYQFYNNYTSAVLDHEVCVKFKPQKGYLYSVKGVFINIIEEMTGNVNILIYDGNRLLVRREFPISEIEPGEWQELVLQTHLERNKEYKIYVTADNYKGISPYMMTVGSDMGILEQDGINDGEQLLLSYQYGEEVNLPFIINIIITLLCLNCYVLAKNKIIPNVECHLGTAVISAPEVICLFAILLSFLISHLYLLGENAYGLNADEMGLGYDAWTLANFGTDRWGTSWPVYILNHGNGSSILYTICCIPFVAIWGVNAITIRIPMVLFGVLFLFVGSIYIYRKYQSWKSVIVFGVLCSILPYFIVAFRIGLDCNVAIVMLLILLVMVNRAIRKANKSSWVLLGIAIGISLYSYALMWIVVPGVVCILFSILIYERKVRMRELICVMTPIIFIAVPLVLFNVVNIFGLNSICFGPITIPRIENYRSGILGVHSVIERVPEIFDSIFSDGGTVYGAIKPVWWIMLPFGLVGLIHCVHRCVINIKQKVWDNSISIVVSFVVIMVVALMLDTVCTYRINMIFLPIIMFIVDGIVLAMDNKWGGRRIVLCMSAIILIAESFRFGQTYWINIETPEISYYELDEVASFIDKINEDDDREVYIATKDGWWIYAYYLEAYHISPIDFITYGSRQNFKNIHFDINDDLERDNIYIIDNRWNDYLSELSSIGMTIRKIDNYWVAY